MEDRNFIKVLSEKAKSDDFDPLKFLNENVLQSRCTGLGYSAQFFMAYPQAIPAYRLLGLLVHRLTTDLSHRARKAVERVERICLDYAGPDSADHEKWLRTASEAVKEKRDIVLDACTAFVTLLQPCCWTIYYIDERVNRITLLANDGLFFREAVRGIPMLQQAPRAVLFDTRSGPMYDQGALDRIAAASKSCDKVAASNGLNDAGKPLGFRWRESIVDTWAFRVRIGSSALAVFANYRTPRRACIPTLLAADVPQRSVRKAVEEWHDEELTAAREIGSVGPALRMLEGWLCQHRLDQIGLDVPHVVDVGNVVDSLVPILQQTEYSDTDRKALISAVRSVVPSRAPGSDIPAKTVCVHWIRPGSAQVPRHLEPDRTHGYESEQEIYPIEVKPNQILLGNGNRGTLSGQAAAWGTSLLVGDLDATKTFHGCAGYPQDGWTWRRQRIGYKGESHAGEVPASAIIVPIGWCGEYHGVIDLESTTSGSLTVEDLRATELVAQVFSALVHLREHHKARDVAFVDSVLGAGTRIRTVEDLFGRYCAEAVERAGADLACLVVYDSLTQSFRPRGLQISVRLLTLWLEHSLGLGGDRLRELAGISVETKSTEGALKRIFQHAAVAHWRPRQHGHTWRVYTGQEPFHYDCQTSPKRAPTCDYLDDPVAATPFQTQLAFPFGTQLGASADGVVWLNWLDVPDASLVTHHTEQDIKALVDDHQTVLTVVAATAALCRYAGAWA